MGNVVGMTFFFFMIGRAPSATLFPYPPLYRSSSLLIVKQVVGIVARRIVCYLKAGDEVTLGRRFGLIRFGSRVDLILPEGVDLRVGVGDRVRGGETVIGVCLPNV